MSIDALHVKNLTSYFVTEKRAIQVAVTHHL